MTDLQLSKIVKPSKLIKIALADLKKAEKLKKFEVSNETIKNNWAVMSDKGICSVCVAGAIMTGSLKVLPRLGVDLQPSDFKSSNQLEAINDLRNGYLKWAMSYLLPDEAFPRSMDRKIAPYSNPRKFHADMKAWAKDLERVGL